MKKESLILFGAGGHAKACIDVIEQQNKFRISGLVGREDELGLKVSGYEVIASDKNLNKLSSEFKHALIVVGQIKSPDTRIRLYNEILGAGFKIPKIISPHAYVSAKAQIGIGTIVMHGAIINSNVLVGNNCIINTGCVIEHDTQIRDHSHISTGAIVNGCVSIGEGTFIGSASVVQQGVVIGERSVIGMGSSLRRNLNSNSTYFEKTDS